MKVLFTTKSPLGTYDYCDDHTYVFICANQGYAWTHPCYLWRFHEGKVEYNHFSDWFPDAHKVQEAYANYLAKLVLEEP